MFREGILNGSPDLKEQVARTIGECIQYLTPVALKPSVVNITGNSALCLVNRLKKSGKFVIKTSSIFICFILTINFVLKKNLRIFQLINDNF